LVGIGMFAHHPSSGGAFPAAVPAVPAVPAAPAARDPLMVTAERNRASNAAAATAAPPFSDTLLTEEIPLARSASLASAAATNPTGMPTTNAGSTPRYRISVSAAGSPPT